MHKKGGEKFPRLFYWTTHLFFYPFCPKVEDPPAVWRVEDLKNLVLWASGS
jgi:hypothetical protein